MTEVVVKVPYELAQRARSAGLLTDRAIQRLLEEAMRREAGRRLMQVAERLHAAGVEPMSEEEIVAEIKAARGKRGPASKLAQQIEVTSQLPKTEQQFVSQMITTVSAQAAR